MPAGDGTGPEGKGPGTGRRLGPCSNGNDETNTKDVTLQERRKDRYCIGCGARRRYGHKHIRRYS